MQNILVFVLGAMMGSAANALVDRLPRNESWFAGRSHCDKCKHRLEWYDLVPIISYLTLRGRCRYCGAPISYRNLMVEVFLGAGFVLISNLGNLSNLGQVVLMGMLWVTTVIAVMDWETRLVSEVMVGIWAGLVVLGHLGNLSNLSYLGGMVAGVGVIGGLWAVTRGKAMGFGDVEIAAVVGWWLGWPGIAVGLWVAFVTGAVIGVIKLIRRLSNLKSEIAFGPFLVLGAWMGWLWGEKIIGLVFK